VIEDLLEEKGTFKILEALVSHQSPPLSKYEIGKLTDLSRKTLDKRIDSLKRLKLITETCDIGPRSRTEICLTEKGKEIAELLVQIDDKVRALKIM
jgi:DNA-binding HxlR family transcriptional regulator